MDSKPTKGVEFIEEIVEVEKILEEGKVEEEEDKVEEEEDKVEEEEDKVEEEEETPPIATPRKRGPKKKIRAESEQSTYRQSRLERQKMIQEEDEICDPEEKKARKKKREIEYKLSKLKCTLTEDHQPVSGKRQKKAPERLEVTPINRRKFPKLAEGKGIPLGSLMWTSHQLGRTCLSTLRLLHRTIFRKQGNFIEKHIIKEVWKFRGFPYDANHIQVKLRRSNLEKQKDRDLQSLCHVLGLPMGTHSVMVDSIMHFLMRPTENMVDNKYKAAAKVENAPCRGTGALPSDNLKITQSLQFILNPNLNKPDSIKHFVTSYEAVSNTGMAPWRKPAFFEEGNGVKLKYIRQVASNIEMANDNFIELLHRLLYLRTDDIGNMRKSILEFSGLKCLPGTNNYLYRTKIISLLPADQVKLVCRVLGLPTWHRTRQLLSEGIMDFLTAPRISAMKRKVPPHFTDEISFSFETGKNPKPIAEESEEYEKIEVFPDIHILPDDEEDAPYEDCDSSSCLTNEYLGVKLKNFANIYYQVINGSASKLNDVHMIMYLTTSTQNSVRNNVLEFAGFPFDESSKEYFCRKSFMEQMNLHELKYVAGILCVSQYIVDESKSSLIDAILKFLLKPSALLNSSITMPTPSLPQWCPVVTSTSYTPPQNETFPEIMISEVKTLAHLPTTDSPNNGAISSTRSVRYEQSAELERMKACLSSDIQIVPVTSIKVEDTSDEDMLTSKANSIQIYPVPQSSAEEEDVSLSRVKSKEKKSLLSKRKGIINKNRPRKRGKASKAQRERQKRRMQQAQDVNKNDSVPTSEKTQHAENVSSLTTKCPQPVEESTPCSSSGGNATSSKSQDSSVTMIPAPVAYIDSDDEDDKPLSKMIGHPNDEQLKGLVTKIVKESKLEDVTMKIVIKKVFDNYPNFDLGYRKEFIKSIVRQILSQMEDRSRVSTTVNI